MSNWKVAGPDHIQGFWFKKATCLHPKLKQHLQEWMTEIKTYCQMNRKDVERTPEGQKINF